MSTRYKLDKQDGLKILKVLGYSVASALVASLIALLPQIDLPAGLAILIPIVNAGLVALQKLLKDSNGILGVGLEK